MQKYKLPIGIQTFRKLREGNYIYVDKTKYIYDILTNFSYVFLSRPRRFGKSLFLDTIRNIFEGNKELFEGLWIYDKRDWSQKYPVIKISWAGDLTTLEQLKQTALFILEKNQENLDIKCRLDDEPSVCFGKLIKESYKKYGQKVVILIDEYDKPILDVIENTKQAKINREFLRGFYSVIKDADEYVRFAFLTGVSKFSKASIFSGLNMLTDLSLSKLTGDAFGITQQELEQYFDYYLQGQSEKLKQKIKEWYNGYYFLGQHRLYNPFDILQFFANDYRFKNYWFESGTPTFLIKLLAQKNYFLPRLSGLKIGEYLLNVFDIEKIDVEVLLFQAGYLTIKEVIEEYDETVYELGIPNKEVEISLGKVLLKYFVGGEDFELKHNLRKALLEGNIELLIESLKTFFAKLPHTSYDNTPIQHYEGYYANILFTLFMSLGLDIIPEDITNQGRIDLTVKIGNKIYIFEIKLDKYGQDPLKQIKEKKYYEKYLTEGKQIYLVGIIFSDKEKNIVSYGWEKIK